jgi:hypothetical protein
VLQEIDDIIDDEDDDDEDEEGDGGGGGRLASGYLPPHSIRSSTFIGTFVGLLVIICF